MKKRYHYYTIVLPGDCVNTLAEGATSALAEARDRARLSIIPAEWRVKHLSGNIGDWKIAFRVTRIVNHAPMPGQAWAE